MTTPVKPLSPGDSAWFRQARLGLFIHWGLYAMGARHEWLKSREAMDDQEYDRYFRHFDPDLYCPERWAQEAYDAGMKYMVVTTKHHEGFCLWDSKFTQYKAPNTPAGRDLLHPLVDAFRAKGLRIGFYYSLLDWHHPDYTIDGKHPMRNRPEYVEAAKHRDISVYVDYLFAQTRELLTEFGQIDVLWYDFPVPPSPPFAGKGAETWKSADLIRMIRELQPQILLNDRLGITQDIRTPEQVQPEGPLMMDGKPVVWEACHTFSGSWGYYRDEASWKSSEMIIAMLADSVSKGGNLLLNVGPNSRGEFDPRASERLARLGQWMHLNSRAIYGCTAAPEAILCPPDCRLTYNPRTKRLYVHLLAWPFKYLHLHGLKGRVDYAQLLHDGSEIRLCHLSQTAEEAPGLFHLSTSDDVISLELPTLKPPVEVPVIELFLHDA